MTWTKNRIGSLALTALFLVACDAGSDGSPATAPLSAEVDSVSLRWSAGECVGYCQGTTDVGASLQGTYTEAPWSENAAYPPKLRLFTVAAADWQNIETLAGAAMSGAWQASYGCPDCADGGAWQLTVRTGDGHTRATTLDNLRANNPAPLEQLLEAVHALDADTPLAPIGG